MSLFVRSRVGDTEFRIMPGEMFSGKWQVEQRQRVERPRYGGTDLTPWSFVSEHDSQKEAIEALPKEES